MKSFTVDQRKELVEAFNQSPSGSYIYIENYQSAVGSGEVADYYLQFGIKYENALNASLEKLKLVKEGKILKYVNVDWAAYVDTNGNLHSRPAEGRTLQKQPTKQVYWNDSDFQSACDEIAESLTAPKKTENNFKNEGKGLYSHADSDTLYIRECLLILKKVTKSGPASNPRGISYEKALKDEIRSLLPVSQYRSFRLDGRFDRVSINHIKILPDVADPIEVSLGLIK